MKLLSAVIWVTFGLMVLLSATPAAASPRHESGPASTWNQSVAAPHPVAGCATDDDHSSCCGAICHQSVMFVSELSAAPPRLKNLPALEAGDAAATDPPRIDRPPK
jgi:hypothetical protein